MRGRGGRTSDEPRKWTYPFAAWMACVFERGGEVSARSRREARARGVRGARIPRLYDAQSGVASNISLRMGGRAGDRPSGGGGASAYLLGRDDVLRHLCFERHVRGTRGSECRATPSSVGRCDAKMLLAEKISQFIYVHYSTFSDRKTLSIYIIYRIL